MNDKLEIKLYATTLDCKDPQALAKFYAELMGWEVVPFFDGEYAVAGAPGKAQGAYPGLTFQLNPDYVPPVWPSEPGAQQQMTHLDFAVNDLEKAVQHAIKCGASIAPQQFTQDWTVMLDPAGHPFCLCRGEELFRRPEFALL